MIMTKDRIIEQRPVPTRNNQVKRAMLGPIFPPIRVVRNCFGKKQKQKYIHKQKMSVAGIMRRYFILVAFPEIQRPSQN